jgi:VIT1/CCC1 family predicted Fe2+/Mn2+ transporter
MSDTTARAELGLDPDERGSSRSAAMSILVWFTLSTVVMVLPYIFGSGMAALSLATASACVALFAVGAAIGQLNSRGAMRSGAQLVLIGDSLPLASESLVTRRSASGPTRVAPC